jgi:hypothetical protein
MKDRHRVTSGGAGGRPGRPIILAPENRTHQDRLQLPGHPLITGQHAFFIIHRGLEEKVCQRRRA